MNAVITHTLETLHEQVQNGDFDDRPYSLASALEALANIAWDDVDDSLAETYETDIQPSLTIE